MIWRCRSPTMGYDEFVKNATKSEFIKEEI